MEFKIPQPLKEEHEELHAELVRAAQGNGRVGEAARAVAKILEPHFTKEEEYALPPLGLLFSLSSGKISAAMADALKMTEKLKADFSQMLKEHEAIVDALKELKEAAAQEGKPEYVRLAEKLVQHAKIEEEILYPAALLVGEYLKWRLERESETIKNMMKLLR